MLLHYGQNKSSATSKPLQPFYTDVTKCVVVLCRVILFVATSNLDVLTPRHFPLSKIRTLFLVPDLVTPVPYHTLNTRDVCHMQVISGGREM